MKAANPPCFFNASKSAASLMVFGHSNCVRAQAAKRNTVATTNSTGRTGRWKGRWRASATVLTVAKKEINKTRTIDGLSNAAKRFQSSRRENLSQRCDV